MSLYKSSSLAMIPTAYKDGKLYSVRPTDGSGDFTFSRGSNLAATRVDVNGLIEKGRENLLLQSNQFDTTWSTANGASVTGGQSGYDGSSDAWLLEKTATAASHIVQSITQSGVQTFSVYVKANTLSKITLWANVVGSGNPFAEFDLSTQTLSDSSLLVASDISSVSGGWYRVSASFNENITIVRIYVEDFSAVTAGSIYIQDAQLEQGLVATDYIETGTSAAQSGILEDMPRLDYSGGASCPSLLLEPQRSNLLPNSEYFGAWNNTTYPVTITSNAATSPDGTTNATLITPTSGSDRHAIREINVVAIAGTTYTLSAFFKKAGSRYVVFGDSGDNLWRLVTADLDEGTITNETNATGTIEPYANDWYRITCTFTRNNPPTIQTFLGASPNDTNIAAPSFDNTSLTTYVYGAQVEASSSYPTSYIPTYGSSVTRSFDNAGTRTDMQDFLGTDTGAWFMHLDEFYFDITGTGLGSIILAVNGQQATSIELIQDGQFQYKITLNNSTAIENLDGEDKLLMNWSSEFFKIFINGVERYSSTSSQWSNAFTHLILPQTTRAPHIKIKQMLFFPTALTDSECIALTTL